MVIIEDLKTKCGIHYEELLPKFKSAKNTPYKNVELQRLRENASRIRESNEQAYRMNLRNETTQGHASSRNYQADVEEHEDDTIM